jgi:integrase
MRGDQFDPGAPESHVQFVGVVCIVTDEILWRFWDNHLQQSGLGQLHFVRSSTFNGYSYRKTTSVCHGHDLRSLATFRFADLRSPFLAGAKLPSMKASHTSSRPRARRSSAIASRTPRTIPDRSCAIHLKAAFPGRKLVEITADAIEDYLRNRLRQRVRVKVAGGYREKGILKSTTVHQEFRVLRRMLNVAVRKKLLAANPCSGVEFPVAVKGLFRPHYVTWSEQEQIESHGPEYLKNAVQIITETGLRVYKELTSMKKDQVDLPNAVVWIPDSKTPNGTAEVPLTPLAVEAFRRQMAITGNSLFLFPSDRNRSGHQTTFKTVWRKTLRRAKVPYFRIYDLRSTYATRLSAGGVADEWVTQMLRQGDAQVFKKYSQMKLQMKREALEKLNRRASEMAPTTGERMRTVMVQ